MEASRVEGGSYLETSRLTPGDLGGCVAAIVLFISLYLPWFGTSDNPNSVIEHAGIGPEDTANAWETFALLDWLLLAACSAPFILAWIIMRGHKLTWKPGEITMIVGITGLVLILCNGIILGRPDPGVEVSLEIGYFVALLASAGLAFSGYLRQAIYTEGRKPPGVI